MKVLLMCLCMFCAQTTIASTIRGQLALDLVAMMKKVQSVDLVAKNIRCTRNSNGLRVTNISCDMNIQSYKGEKRIRVINSLAKNLWSQVPGDSEKSGQITMNGASKMNCYFVEKCDSLNMDCMDRNVCTISE